MSTKNAGINTECHTEPVEVLSAETKDGYKETKLGFIPEDWNYSEIKTFVNQLNGFAFKSDEFNQENRGIRLCRGINITKGHLRFDDKNEMYWENTNELNIDKYILQHNDIVISMDGSLLGRNYSMVDEKYLPLLLVQRVARLRTKPKMSQSFLFHWVSSDNFIRYVDSVKTSSGIPHISAKDINNFKIAIPPLPEQQKIANILNTWDKAIAAQVQLIAQKQALKKGLMQKLLTGKKRFAGFTEEWKEVRLGDVCNVKGMYGIGAAAVPFSNDLPRYLRITDIDDSGNYSPEKEVSISENHWKEYVLEKGDIVFARTGNTTGKTYLYQKKDGILVYAGFLIKFKPMTNKLNANYLKFFTQTKPYWDWVKTMSVRSGQPGINSKEYSRLKLNLPSIMEQNKVVEILSSYDTEIRNIVKYKNALEQQKQGLMQQLLTGEKRVKI